MLISLAYQVVTVGRDDDGAVATGPVRYDIVRQPAGVRLDPDSHRIHGIDPRDTHVRGRPLEDVLRRFLTTLRDVGPGAVVGHDVASDAALLVSEALRVGLCVSKLTPLRVLLCTKQMALGRCRIPLPGHLRYEFPCDALLLPSGEEGEGGVDRPAFKWPNLDECVRLLAPGDVECSTSRPHDARGDVQRCRVIFLELLRGA